MINTEGEEWRHHRRIVGPAFNEDMNEAVWQTTSDVMFELFSKWEAEVSSPSIPVQSFLEIAMEMALLVLCRAGNHF
jgi:cytochrome P450